MPLDRTGLNLSNDSGGLTDGTVWNAAYQTAFMDAIDAALAVALGRRVVAITSSATPTPNCDTTDLYDVTALAGAAAFAAPTGTPVNAQKLLIRIKDNGTARALTWNAIYAAGGAALPTTTVLSKILYVAFIYNTANSLNKWQCVATAQE